MKRVASVADRGIVTAINTCHRERRKWVELSVVVLFYIYDGLVDQLIFFELR